MTLLSPARLALGACLAFAPAIAAAQAPLPPPRPNASFPASAAPAAGAPVATARAEPATGQAEIVQRAADYLNGLSSLTGDFSQVGADGRRYRGKLYVQKPGKLRFEY